MVDNDNQYIPMVHIVDRNKRRERLASRLEVCADRICDLQDRLMAGITALRPIEYDRLLDEYRAELVRYDNIDRELRQLEDPTKQKSTGLITAMPASCRKIKSTIKLLTLSKEQELWQEQRKQ